MDYAGTVGDADEHRATVKFDDGTSDVISFTDPDVRVTREAPAAAPPPAAKPSAKAKPAAKPKPRAPPAAKKPQSKPAPRPPRAAPTPAAAPEKKPAAKKPRPAPTEDEPPAAHDVDALVARNAPIVRTEKPRSTQRAAAIEAATTAREYIDCGGKKEDLRYDLRSDYFRVGEAAPTEDAAPPPPKPRGESKAGGEGEVARAAPAPAAAPKKPAAKKPRPAPPAAAPAPAPAAAAADSPAEAGGQTSRFNGVKRVGAQGGKRRSWCKGTRYRSATSTSRRTPRGPPTPRERVGGAAAAEQNTAQLPRRGAARVGAGRAAAAARGAAAAGAAAAAAPIRTADRAAAAARQPRRRALQGRH